MADITTPICLGPECGRKPESKGMCATHYMQARRGQSLSPIRVVSDNSGACKGPGCARPAVAVGMCGTHYSQHKRGAELTPILPRAPYGSIDKTPKPQKPRQPAAERFWERVDKSGECWKWTGYRDKDGYGEFHAGEGFTSRKAHRYSHFLATGEEPPVVDHMCFTKSCVRPDHLRAATVSGNTQNQAPGSVLAESGFRNVFKSNNPNHPYKVAVIVNGKYKHLGYFDDADEANRVAIEARRKYYPYSQW